MPSLSPGWPLRPLGPRGRRRTARRSPPKKRKVERNNRSKPVVDAFFAWCEKTKAYALDDSPLAKGLTYALDQREALRRFLADGRLPIDDNASELQLRRQAVGRKNWLFIASEAGALANTTFVTLLASCQMHGIEPQGDLRDVLCLLPAWPVSRVLELAPAYWKQTLEKDETQRFLAENVFRRIAPRTSVAIVQRSSTRR